MKLLASDQWPVTSDQRKAELQKASWETRYDYALNTALVLSDAVLRERAAAGQAKAELARTRARFAEQLFAWSEPAEEAAV